MDWRRQSERGTAFKANALLFRPPHFDIEISFDLFRWDILLEKRIRPIHRIRKMPAQHTELHESSVWTVRLAFHAARDIELLHLEARPARERYDRLRITVWLTVPNT